MARRMSILQKVALPSIPASPARRRGNHWAARGPSRHNGCQISRHFSFFRMPIVLHNFSDTALYSIMKENPADIPMLSRASTTFTNGSWEITPDPIFDELSWYHSWLLQQIHSQPDRLFLALPNIKQHTDITGPVWNTQFVPFWNRIRDLILDAVEPRTIESITDALLQANIITVNDNYEAYKSAKELVFTTIGWQTMLYKAKNPSNATEGFSIHDEMNGFLGESRLCLDQHEPACGHDLPSLLLGFGVMLPQRNYCTFVDDDDRQLFNSSKSINAKDVNAYVLQKVCGVKIQWVDSFSCHLELDKQAGILFLYRYPSFCLANLGGESEDGRGNRKTVVQCCGVNVPGSMPWANEADITELLAEILLSYRLLFGQSRRSRNLFRRLQPFAQVPKQGHDKLLSQICTKKQFTCPIPLIEREQYDLSNDFPHLRNRLVRLNSYASEKKPRSVRQIWKDKRDSTAWLAFWSVLFFGSVSIVLALIQTVFQIMQYAIATRQKG